MASILSVHRTPNRNDQFQIKFSDDGEKDHLTYRRESGKGLDVWVEGIDLCASECRKQVKDKKSAVEKKETALKRMRGMNQKWTSQNGWPNSDEQWKAWYDYFKNSNYDEDLIRQLWMEMTAQSTGRNQRTR